MDITCTRRKEISHIIDRSWGNSLTNSDIDRWLNNFTGSVFDKDIEQRIAVYLLHHFVYFSKSEIRHLCQILYSKFIHELAKKCGIKVDLATYLENKHSEILFKMLGKPSESGGMMLYLFRQVNDLRVNSFEEDSAAYSKAKILVLLDDVSLTGSQASDYLEDALQKSKIKKESCYFLALFITDAARKTLTKKGYTCISAIDLPECENSFKAIRWGDITDLNGLTEADIEKFCRHYGNLCKPNDVGSLGFGDQGKLIGFFHNTPDNTLPIFWGKCNGWFPLFERFHKNYKTHNHTYAKKEFI